MFKYRYCLAILVTLFSTTLLAQKPINKEPTIQDLEFLIGKWEINFDLYNTKKPEKGIVSRESGFQICEYALSTNDVPMFIICTGEVTNEKGRTRSFQESIRYSQFSQSFERYGLFSHWSSTSKELLVYEAEKRLIAINGSLGYSRGRTERYVDRIVFDESFKTYQREHKSNLSDMPGDIYNLGLKGQAKKVE